MNKHIASVIPFRPRARSLRRDEIIDCMAGHLMAAVLHGGLDVMNERDCIMCLMDAPERYRLVFVCALLPEAMYELDQRIIARSMGED